MDRPAASSTPTLILVALADPCCYPAFGQHTAIVFARHTGPFGILDAGHFPQWEAAKIMNDAIAMFCADRLGGRALAPASGDPVP